MYARQRGRHELRALYSKKIGNHAIGQNPASQNAKARRNADCNNHDRVVGRGVYFIGDVFCCTLYPWLKYNLHELPHE